MSLVCKIWKKYNDIIKETELKKINEYLLLDFKINWEKIKKIITQFSYDYFLQKKIDKIKKKYAVNSFSAKKIIEIIKIINIEFINNENWNIIMINPQKTSLDIFKHIIVPETTQQLPNIKQIRLITSYSIEYLSKNITKFTNLEKITFYVNNYDKKLPTWLVDIPNLKTICISYEINLISLPTYINNLPHLILRKKNQQYQFDEFKKSLKNKCEIMKLKSNFCNLF